jgi:hypothetical protein
MQYLFRALCVATVLLWSANSAFALDLTQRKVDVADSINVSSASKIADKLISFDAQADAPIYLMISATEGSLQGVMLLADTIQSMKSPVVSVVITQVHGAGAALAPFADQVVMYSSSGLVFTSVEYEGVSKPEPPESDEPSDESEEDSEEEANDDDKEEVTPEDRMLQTAREDFLDRFHTRLAKRISWSKAKFAKKLEEGGFLVSPTAAVRQKIAKAVVNRITYTELPESKKEVKITTSHKRSRAVKAATPTK